MFGDGSPKTIRDGINQWEEGKRNDAKCSDVTEKRGKE